MQLLESRVLLTAPTLANGSTLNYTENQAATAINTAITVNDTDSATLPSATVSITNNFAAGQDVLGFVNDGATMGNIAGSYVGNTLTLTSAGGTATLTQWQAALRAVTYSNSSENPSTSARTVSYVVNDGTDNSNTVTSTVNVAAVNDAPTANITPVSYTTNEKVTLTLHGTGLSISDPDAGTSPVKATVSVKNGVLNAAAGTTGVTVSGSGTATVTLDGTLAQINNFLAGNLSATLTYTASTDPPAIVPLTLTVDDLGNTGTGGPLTSADVANINVTPVNDPPTLTANAAGFNFTEAAGLGTQAAPVAVFTNANAGTVEAGQTIIALEFTVSGLLDGVKESIVVDGTTITLGGNSAGTTATNGMSYTVTVAAGTATISLTKAAGVSTTAINTLVNGITYQNTNADNPSAGNRVFKLTKIQDNGGGAPGDTGTLNVTSTVQVIPVNDPPTLTATAYGQNFTEAAGLGTQAPPVKVYKDASTGTVEAGQTIIGLKFTVSGLLDGANESLVVDGTTITLGGNSAGTTATNGMAYTVTIAAGTATISLTKAAGVSTANINTLVNGISYQNTNADNPSAGARTFILTQIQDSGGAPGDTTPLAISSTITVSAINDAPTATITPISYDAAKGVALTLHGTGLSIADPDAGNANVQTVLKVSSGILNATAGATGVTISGSGTATLTLSGTVAQINNLLAGNSGATLTYTASTDLPKTVTLTLTAKDLGNTGTGGPLTGADIATINVVPVNHAPVVTVGTALLKPISANTVSPPGATVASLFSKQFSDSADQIKGVSSANTFAGIAISSYTVDPSRGNWQYSTDNGGTWTTLPTATVSAAITLNATDLLRFVPKTNYYGPATPLSANLIESGQTITSGAAINLNNATGGSTHISSATVTLNHTILPSSQTVSQAAKVVIVTSLVNRLTTIVARGRLLLGL